MENVESLDEIPDDVIATLSDYLDNALPDAERAEVEKKVADDPLWKRAHEELVGTRSALSTLRRARAPEKFDQDVTSTIHKRSAGRFFARRTFGDRVPFGVLFAIGIVVLLVIAYMMWSSPTGAIHAPKHPAPQQHEELKF